MSQKEFQQTKMDIDDMEVILRFPTESKNQTVQKLKKEVREILVSELQEQIRQMTQSF